MVRAWLRDDVETPLWSARPTQMDPVRISLDDDGCPLSSLTSTEGAIPEESTSGYPVLTVRLRTRTGFDDDGVPEFDWETLVETEAIVYSERTEFDAEAGFTLVKATAVLAYEGDRTVTETAGVWSDDGSQWRVKAVRQVPGRLEFDLERIHADA